MLTKDWAVGPKHTDDEMRQMINHRFDLSIPEGARRVQFHRQGIKREVVGSVTKLVPDERYSLLRNPNYTQIEEKIVRTYAMVTWIENGKRMAQWVLWNES